MPNETKPKAGKGGAKSGAKKPTAEEKREADYQSACSAAKWGQWTVFYQDRAEFYRMAQQKLEALGDYKDSAEQAAFCARQAEEAETAGADQALQEAMDQAAKASSASDYYQAAQALERITDRPEAGAEAKRCMSVYDQLCHRQKIKKLMIAAVLCLCVLLGIGMVWFGAAQYGYASFWFHQENYAGALKWYQKAKDFADSQEQIDACRYYRGIELQEQGKHHAAYDKFRLIPGYQYADERLLDSACLMMAELEPGDTVTFGLRSNDKKAKWFVLENDGTSVTLIADFQLEHSYHSTSEEVTWESCALREWLNSDFLADTFSEPEQSLILETPLSTEANSVYGTAGGVDTTDRVYLLSEREVEQYASILFGKDEDGNPLDPLKREKLGWRLRTPGAANSGTAYVDVKSQLNRYGFEATATRPTVRPVIRVATRQ